MLPPSQYFSLSIADAILLQRELCKSLCIQPLQDEVATIAGADISFDKNTDVVHAGIVVLSYPELRPLEHVTVVSRTTFPYIPGLLAFREVPALLEAWGKLQTKPDLIVLDGQGITHERRTGIATHFGLLTDVPSIGCAKSSLWGKYVEPAQTALSHSPIYEGAELLGFALRSKKGCKPIYLSPGHKISVQQSLKYMLPCLKGYRIPEPTRRAHLLVNVARVAYNSPPPQLSLF